MRTDAQFPNMLKLYESDVKAYPESHLDLPIKVAMHICGKFPSYWDYLMDFIQEGNLELLRCVEVFNQEHPGGSNEHFRNYAAACIRGVIYVYFSRIGPIYIPHVARQRFVKQEDTDALSILEQHFSWNALYESLTQTAEPTNMLQAYDAAKTQQIHTLLTCLAPSEKQVILLWYGLEDEGLDPKDIAQRMNMKVNSIYVLHQRAIARMNGSNHRLPRVMKERRDAQARREQLQPIYDTYHGNITQQQLVDITGCTHHQAGTFLREKRGKTKEMNPAVRREKMEALYAEWHAQGKKVTVREFCKAGRWDGQEAGAFLREKRNAP